MPGPPLVPACLWRLPVPIRAPLPRVLMWGVGLFCGLVAVAGGLALQGPELVAVGVAGVLAGCMAAGIARETPAGSRSRSTAEAAAFAGATTVGVLLLLAGIAALAGGAVAFLSVGAVLLGLLVVRAVRVLGTAARSAPGLTGGGPAPPGRRPAGRPLTRAGQPPPACRRPSDSGPGSGVAPDERHPRRPPRRSGAGLPRGPAGGGAGRAGAAGPRGVRPMVGRRTHALERPGGLRERWPAAR